VPKNEAGGEEGGKGTIRACLKAGSSN